MNIRINKGPGPGLGVLVWLRTRVIVLSQIIGWSRLFDWKPESVCPSVKFSQIIGFADYLTNDSKRRVYGFECRVNQNHSKNWFAVQFSPIFRIHPNLAPKAWFSELWNAKVVISQYTSQLSSEANFHQKLSCEVCIVECKLEPKGYQSTSSLGPPE